MCWMLVDMACKLTEDDKKAKKNICGCCVLDRRHFSKSMFSADLEYLEFRVSFLDNKNLHKFGTLYTIK